MVFLFFNFIYRLGLLNAYFKDDSDIYKFLSGI